MSSQPLSRRLATPLLLLLTWLPACGDQPSLEEEETGALAGRCVQATQGRDDTDRDGLDDNYENCLLERRAPIVFLAGTEEYYPTNADQFLANSDLHFRHGQLCGSCGVRARPRQQDLLGWSHEKKFGVGDGLVGGTCKHKSPTRANTVHIENGGMNNDHHFYLEVSQAMWRGSRDGNDWRMYGHVFPRDGGVEVQFWFLFGYSDAALSDNHQGDWEAMSTRLDARGEVISVRTCAHGACQDYSAGELTFSDGHPHVFVASGTHAIYPSRRVCDRKEYETKLGSLLGGCPGGGLTWFAGEDTVFVDGSRVPRAGDIRNLGEREHPLYGQLFVKSNFKWGRTELETGVVSRRDGPVTPSYQGFWGIEAPSEPGGGVGGGGSCEDSCGPNRERRPGDCGECVCSSAAVESCAAQSSDRVKYALDGNCDCMIQDGQQ